MNVSSERFFVVSALDETNRRSYCRLHPVQMMVRSSLTAEEASAGGHVERFFAVSAADADHQEKTRPLLACQLPLPPRSVREQEKKPGSRKTRPLLASTSTSLAADPRGSTRVERQCSGRLLCLVHRLGFLELRPSSSLLWSPRSAPARPRHGLGLCSAPRRRPRSSAPTTARHRSDQAEPPTSPPAIAAPHRHRCLHASEHVPPPLFLAGFFFPFI